MKLSIITFLILATIYFTSCTNNADDTTDSKTSIDSDTSKKEASETLKKHTPVNKELYDEIALMDSVMFDAFNTQQFDKFKSLFTEDLEWFQDNDGVVPYKTVFENFENTFKKENKLTRQLVPGSLEVYPVKDYGAIEIGQHQFRHIENGKEEIGTFKFLMIWQKKNDGWKISRVVSYSH